MSNIRKLVAETVGTLLLVFLAVGCAVLAVAARAGVPGVSPGTTVLAVAFGVGLVLLGVLVAVGPLARIHMTPAVTFALVRRRSVPVDAAVDAWIGQVIGAVVGGCALYLFLPWATTDSESGASTAFTLQDVLIAGLLSVVLLVAPMAGVAVIAIFSTPDRLLLRIPVTVEVEAVPEPPIATVLIPEPTQVPEPVLEPVLEPVPLAVQEPEPALEPALEPEPEPVLEPVMETAPVEEPETPESARPVVYASAESTASRPSPPRATLTSTRVSTPATRVVAPFPPAPEPSPFPLRRAVAPARHAAAFAYRPGRNDLEGDDGRRDKGGSKGTSGKKDKRDKARKAKSGRKSKSTVTVQVKVTDKHAKAKKGKKKKK